MLPEWIWTSAQSLRKALNLCSSYFVRREQHALVFNARTPGFVGQLGSVNAGGGVPRNACA